VFAEIQTADNPAIVARNSTLIPGVGPKLARPDPAELHHPVAEALGSHDASPIDAW
jgi:hypothetical protein